MSRQRRLAPSENGRHGERVSGLSGAAASQLEINHPDPPDDSNETWTMASHAALIGMAVVVMVTALYLARSIVMPVLAAMLIGITLHPIQKHAERYHIPPGLMAGMLVAMFFALLYIAVMLSVGPLTDWIRHAPELGENIKEKLRWLERPLSMLRELQKSMGETAGPSNPTVAVETSLTSMLQGAFSIATPAITEFLVFFGTLLFFLVGTDNLRRQLITFFETREARLRVMRIWSDIEHNLITYVGTVSVINLALGAVTAAMLYVLGFPNPIAFGVLAFALNYIPYIGPAIMVATLFGVGLIALPTLGAALLAPSAFVVLATIEGHFVTPGIIGRRMTLSPFLVFLALAFWTWLWGPLGAFLATPLLIVGLVLLGHLFPKDEVELPE